MHQLRRLQDARLEFQASYIVPHTLPFSLLEQPQRRLERIDLPITQRKHVGAIEPTATVSYSQDVYLLHFTTVL